MAVTARTKRPRLDLSQIVPQAMGPEFRLPGQGEQFSPDAAGNLTPVFEPPPDPGMPPFQPPSTGDVAEYLGGPPSMEGITPVQDIVGQPRKPLRPGFLPALGRTLLKIAPIAGELLQGAAQGAQNPGFLTAAGNTYRTKKMEPLLAIQAQAEADKMAAEAERARAQAGKYGAEAYKTDLESTYIPLDKERTGAESEAQINTSRAQALLAQERANYQREAAKGKAALDESQIRRYNATAAFASAQARREDELIDAGMPQAQARRMAALEFESLRRGEMYEEQMDLLPRGMAVREQQADAQTTQAQAAMRNADAAIQRAQRTASGGTPRDYARALSGLYEDRQQALTAANNYMVPKEIRPGMIAEIETRFRPLIQAMEEELIKSRGGAVQMGGDSSFTAEDFLRMIEQ